MRSTSLFLAQTLVYGCVFETVAIVGSQRSRSVSMERLGQTPRKEQKSIFDFLSPPSAEYAEKKEAAAALLKEAQEQRRLRTPKTKGPEGLPRCF